MYMYMHICMYRQNCLEVEIRVCKGGKVDKVLVELLLVPVSQSMHMWQSR